MRNGWKKLKQLKIYRQKKHLNCLMKFRKKTFSKILSAELLIDYDRLWSCEIQNKVSAKRKQQCSS